MALIPSPPCLRNGIFVTTAGIARNLDNPLALPAGTGGGDLNGTAAKSILHGQAGTTGKKGSVERLPRSVSPNYCGVT